MRFKQKRLLLNTKKFILDLIYIALGTAIMGMGTGIFLIPNKLSTGGFAGIATVIYYLFNLPVGTTTFILNIPLFVFSYFKLGRKFLFKAVCGTFFLSGFINLFQKISPFTNDKILACLYGGILVGIGTAIILKANASTGGSDLVSQIVKRYKKNIRSGTVIIAIDAIVVALNVIVFQQIEIALYSAIAIYIMGKSIDILSEGIYFSKMVYIISDKYDEISERIKKELQRGITAIYSKGMYTGSEKKILLCAVRKK